MIAATKLAEYIISLQDPELGDLTHLKVQKLLYYCYGHVLAAHDVRLFDEPFKAWQHGPVLDSIYTEYKQYGRQVLPIVEGPVVIELPHSIMATIHEVLGGYGQYSAWCLREMTHNEAPWQKAFNDAAYAGVIADSEIKAYFSEASLDS